MRQYRFRTRRIPAQTFIAALLSALLLGSAATRADTLAEIYALAVQNDAQLKAAEAQFRADMETENQAFGQLLPQINASFSRQNSDVSYKDDPTYDSDADTDLLSVQLEQAIFDLNRWFTFKSGKQLSKKAEAEFAAQQQDLIVRVANAYFEVLRRQDNLAASRAEEKAISRQLEQTQQRFDVGLIAITDVHEARAAYDLAVVQRLNDEGLLGVALEALTVITGQIHHDLWLLSEDYPISNPEPLDPSAWVEMALANNFALRAGGYASEAALQQARAAKAQHYPRVSGSFVYSERDQSNDTVGSLLSLPEESESEVLTLSVSMPLFAGGSISATRRQAYERFNTARENLVNTQRRTIQVTRSLHLAVMTDASRVKARQQSITSAQSALDATQAGYDVGTRNVVDVLQAQRTLFNSRRDYANARYDYILDSLRLKQQAGSLSPGDIQQLNNWLQAPAS